MKARKPLERRRDAAQATLDKHRSKPFTLGRNDCAQMVISHARRLGKKLPAPKGYKTAVEARAVLKGLGFKSLAALLDAHFERHPSPAFAVVGDIVEMPGAEGLSGLGVALGNGRVVAFHEEAEGAEVLQPIMMTAAWKVLP